LGRQAEEAKGIIGGVEGSGLDGKAKGFTSAIEGGQAAVLEIAEGAHARDVLWGKATDEGIEGVVAHHRHPDVEAGDPTLHHHQTGTKHARGLAGRASLGLHVQGGQDRVSSIQVLNPIKSYRSHLKKPDKVVPPS
jgi:hypothetical protein